MIMIKFYQIKRVCLLGVLVGIFACERQASTVPVNIEPSCIEQQESCTVNVESGKFTLLFDVEKVISENPFNYFLQYSGSLKVISAQGFVEGENMYMGKIPVIFETYSQQNTLKALGLLGSCSEEVMYWNLHIKVKLKDVATAEIISRDLTFKYRSSRF